MNRENIENMEAGSEIDALVAENIMGWHKVFEKTPKVVFEDWYDSEHHYQHRVSTDDGFMDGEDLHTIFWCPSQSILWAMEVVEKFDVVRLTKSFGLSGVMWIVKIGDIEVFDKSASLAICKASLLSKLNKY